MLDPVGNKTGITRRFGVSRIPFILYICNNAFSFSVIREVDEFSDS